MGRVSDELFAQFAGVFSNARVRRHGRSYVLGLVSQTERKNSWQLAEFAGEASPDGIQRLLNFSPWDEDACRDAVARYALFLARPHRPSARGLLPRDGRGPRVPGAGCWRQRGASLPPRDSRTAIAVLLHGRSGGIRREAPRARPGRAGGGPRARRRQPTAPWVQRCSRPRRARRV